MPKQEPLHSKFENKSRTLETTQAIQLQQQTIETASKEALESFQGLFFYHAHDHIGSLEVLTDLMSLFKQEGVKYFFIEQPMDQFGTIFATMNKNKNILALKNIIPVDLHSKPYMKALFSLYQTALSNGIVLVPVVPKLLGQDTFEALLAKVTTEEEPMLREINKYSDGKCIGLFGRLHVGLAAEKNFPAIALLDVGVKQSWKIDLKQNFAVEELVFNYQKFKQVKNESAQKFLIIAEKLPSLFSAVFSLPSQKPQQNFSNRYFWHTATAGMLLATAGLAIWSRMQSTENNEEDIIHTLTNATNHLKL